jgi:hypothetical protein
MHSVRTRRGDGRDGHTDPALALRVYRQAMRRGDDEKQALRTLVEGRNWQKLADGHSTDRPAASDDKLV